MKVKYTIKTAVTSLGLRKVRSGLTILGIVIGITAIILVVSTGRGAESIIVGELGGFGTDIATLHPGKQPAGVSDVASSLFNDAIGDREIEAISKSANVPELLWVAPDVYIPDSASYDGETYKGIIIGVDPRAMGEMLDISTVEGQQFDELDIKSEASVAVIGDKVRRELFGESDAVGERISIKGRKFKVVGVYEQRGKVSFFDVDDLIIIPPTTANTYVTGNDYYSEVILKAKSPELVDQMIENISITLRELHNIDDPADDDFYFQTQEGTLETVGNILNSFTLFLSFVVGISLVVGGVGVMNIMLVSVRERTREIGLRKALGATSREVLLQFLAEAVVLTAIGGLIGILLGIVLSIGALLLIGKFLGTEFMFEFPFLIAFLSLLASAGVGIIFGIYPARQASKKSPMEALRYE